MIHFPVPEALTFDDVLLLPAHSDVVPAQANTQGWTPSGHADFALSLPPEAGAFFFAREHLHLNQFDSSWITTAPDTEKPSQAALPAKVQK
jgi:hypothetical protein